MIITVSMKCTSIETTCLISIITPYFIVLAVDSAQPKIIVLGQWHSQSLADSKAMHALLNGGWLHIHHCHNGRCTSTTAIMVVLHDVQLPVIQVILAQVFALFLCCQLRDSL